MQDNPYSALAGMFGRNKTALSLYVGRVTKTAPLTVTVEGIDLSGDELKLNASMRPHTADVDLPGIGTVTAEITPEINIGDEHLLLTTDEQVFYVLCKVVSA